MIRIGVPEYVSFLDNFGSHYMGSDLTMKEDKSTLIATYGD